VGCIPPAFESSFTTAERGRLSRFINAVNLRRLIVILYLVLFVGIAVGSGIFFWRSREEYLHLRKAEQMARVRLAEAQQKLREQEIVLDRLRNDPAYVEMVIRRHLGYAKPGERIFLFSDQDERIFLPEPKR
jgi:cell division protein DivIC